MQRAKYGDPLRWLKERVAVETDECILWPYSVSPKGYGTVRMGARTMHAHAAMCILAHGPAPTDKHTDAAHSCGVRLCCNPRHIRHATPLENQRDKIAHGTVVKGSKHGRAKLTEDDVRWIRGELAAGAERSAVASARGVSVAAIRLIQTGKNWAWLP